MEGRSSSIGRHAMDVHSSVTPDDDTTILTEEFPLGAAYARSSYGSRPFLPPTPLNVAGEPHDGYARGWHFWTRARKDQPALDLKA